MLVGAGAGLGAVARYFLTLFAAPGGVGAVFCVLAINAAGSFFMGAARPGAFWGTGVIGGFTTFSAVAVAAAGASATAALGILAAHFAACVAAWFAGDSLRGRARA